MRERAWTALGEAFGWLAEQLHSAELRCLHRAWHIHDRRSLSERHRVKPQPQHYHHIHFAGDDWPPGPFRKGHQRMHSVHSYALSEPIRREGVPPTPSPFDAVRRAVVRKCL